MPDERLRRLERDSAASGCPEDALALLRERARVEGFYPPAVRLPDAAWVAYQRSMPGGGIFVTPYHGDDPRSRTSEGILEGRVRFKPMFPVEFIRINYTITME